MGRWRRRYYDWFSRGYDGFVALHSRDRQGTARGFLADRVPQRAGGAILDLCTGTGTLLLSLRERVGARGTVIGADFSRGMLEVALAKTRSFANVRLVEADAGSLPLAERSFDAVTCSHAFYELKGQTQERALSEIRRVLKPGGVFLMMEHDVPAKWLLRTLFYLRLLSMGRARALSILRGERDLLERHFGSVEKVPGPEGRSKVLICR